MGQGNRLGRRQPHHNAPDQPRARGRGDSVKLGEIHVSIAHGCGDGRVQPRNMGPCRDLGHHALVWRMGSRLAKHDVGQNPGARIVEAQHCRRGFIAAGLNTEDGERRHRKPYAPPASSPVSASLPAGTPAVHT